MEDFPKKHFSSSSFLFLLFSSPLLSSPVFSSPLLIFFLSLLHLVMISDATPTRKRLKVVSACSECRRKKTKCNGEKPCRNCAKANVACEYPVSVANEDKRNTTSKAAVEAIEDRLRTIEDMLKAILKGGQGVANVDKDALLQYLKKETSSLRPNLASGWENTTESEMEGVQQQQPEPSLRLPSISELDKGYSDSQTDTSSLAARSHISSRPLSYESAVPDPATADRFQLPHFSVQQYLYGLFFDLIHPLCPVVDRFQFTSTTLALPSILDDSNMDMCLNYMLGFAVLSCASQVAPSAVLVPIIGTSELPNSSSQQLDPITASDYFFDCATKLLDRHDSIAHPTVVATMSLLVLHYGRGDARQVDKTCSYVTRLNDMAMHLSLHMTHTENSSMSFRQRCLFWSVFTHDRIANLLYGRPVTIEEENIFVDLMTDSSTTNEDSLEVFVEYVKLTRMLGRIMRHSHNPWQLSNLDRALHHWLRALPKALLLPSQDLSQVPVPIRTLHLLFHISILALHKPQNKLEARKPSPATSLSASTSFGALNLSDVATPPTRTPSPPSSAASAAGLGNIPTSTIHAILTIGESFVDPNQRHLMNTNQLLHYALVALARSQLDKMQQQREILRPTMDGEQDQWLIKSLELLKLVSVKPDSELARSVWDIEQQCSNMRQRSRLAEGKRSFESIDAIHQLPPSPQRTHSPDDRKAASTQLLLSPRMQSTTTLTTAVRHSAFGDELKTFDFVPLVARNGELRESRQSISKFIHYTASDKTTTAEEDTSPMLYPNGGPSPPNIFSSASPEHTLKAVMSMPSLHESHRYSRNVRTYARHQHNSASSQLWDLATAAALAER
jgi:hypothetical protein